MMDLQAHRSTRKPPGLMAGGIARDFSDSTVLTDHVHETGLLQVPLSGLMIVSSTDGHWVVPPTKALWLAPGVKHRVRMLGKVKLRSVFIDPRARNGLPAQSCLLPVSPLARELITEVASSTVTSLSSHRSRLLISLLLEEVKQQSPSPLQLPTPRDHRVARICTHVQEHLDDMKSLREWARELGYDRRTLHRLFIQELGVTFVQWRQQAKLLAALEWLAEGRQVLAVALDLGYQTQSAFTAMFRRVLGITPRDFLRSLNTQEDSDSA